MTRMDREALLLSLFAWFGLLIGAVVLFGWVWK